MFIHTSKHEIEWGNRMTMPPSMTKLNEETSCTIVVFHTTSVDIQRLVQSMTRPVEAALCGLGGLNILRRHSHLSLVCLYTDIHTHQYTYISKRNIGLTAVCYHLCMAYIFTYLWKWMLVCHEAALHARDFRAMSKWHFSVSVKGSVHVVDA